MESRKPPRGAAARTTRERVNTSGGGEAGARRRPPGRFADPRRSSPTFSQVHDGRFADLHKDLAGIVWEVSKLRAELARVQQQSSSSAAPPGVARPLAVGEPPEAFGARSWRDPPKY